VPPLGRVVHPVGRLEPQRERGVARTGEVLGTHQDVEVVVLTQPEVVVERGGEDGTLVGNRAHAALDAALEEPHELVDVDE